MEDRILFLILASFIVKGSSLSLFNDTYKPCDPWYPKVPDYSAPGRRLATIKCLEYIWMIQIRQDKMERERDCIISKCTGPCGGGGIGGRDTNDGEFPHMAALGWVPTNGDDWVFKCGGSLISDKFVLTAGHCTRIPLSFDVNDPTPKIVRLGNKNIAPEKPHKDIDIQRIILHPNYRPPKKYYDIALLELADSVTFTKLIHPACLLVPQDIQTFGPKATATGWGITKLGGDTTQELQAVHIDLLDSDFCDNILSDQCSRNWCGLQDHQICAANLTGGVDTCQGDSGGPLQLHIPLPPRVTLSGQIHGIVGVTSFGIRCALADTPGIYSRVVSFLGWIEDIVWRSN